MTNTTKRAAARSHSRAQQQAIDALENAVASVAVADLVNTLRTAAFDTPYIAASLLAGATSLIRGMPNRAPWAALLAKMAREVSDDR
ncbi:hypothetical protein NKH34_25050 [Mesorhizobium sp. M1148]|uniref:hypothetical protein n=1 Tax=unclassified Mesorhizobium TaxID=325217 RepID=UPI00333DA63B